VDFYSGLKEVTGKNQHWLLLIFSEKWQEEKREAK
jgi:hypothetical protein